MEFDDNEIVISGISGRFPNSNNVREFAHNLYNKVDMTDEAESRWKHFTDEVPKRFGKIHNIEKFDASFFSTLNKHANWTDPQMRILLEHAYESILDAGISPQSLIGSKTGVFIGCTISDSKDAFVNRIPTKDGYVVMGNANFYLANRISYALGLCGPSFPIDTACSSSAYALDCAFRYIESGLCDAALVGGSQLILNCGLASAYSKLGILASDGVCRPFDEDAAGFTRAETICVMFLQKRKDSKRIYASVVYSSSNNDGFKKEGASFPSRVMQQKLIEDFYKTVKVDPNDVKFLEAHATGTKLGDPEEVAAIDAVFCKNNSRHEELVIGSVKSNMGHAEAASGMASISKIILTFEHQLFPPNINLKRIRSDIPAFSEGRIKVATDSAKFNGDFIAMNSFGLGGGNTHALFRRNPIDKINQGIPDDNFGRMVLWSGRTETAVIAIFDDITQRPLDAEHIALLQNSQIQTTSANTYRGYGMFINDEVEGKAVCVKKNIQYFNGTQRPIAFVYSGIGSQWLEMGRDLMKIPLFAKSIDYCHDILLKKGIDLKKIITSTDENTFNNVMHSYVGIVAIEIALTDILKALGIVPEFIIGHSVGELGCAYADNCFTAEQTILAAHARGEASQQSQTIQGAMAAVGMHHIKLEEILPDDIDIACHNGDDSTTISGPADSVNSFIEKLKQDKIFAKSVACSGVPLHSRYIAAMGRNLNEKLQKIIKDPKERSKKWLSSTYPEDMWNEDDAYFSSAEYHTRNLLSPVLFHEVTSMLPKNALLIEIAPHGLLKAILKRNIKDGIHVSLTQRDEKDGVEFFMNSLGSLFQYGVDMDISALYPAINFPVSRSTPMISPVIKWNHEEDHFVPHFDSYNAFERRNIVINISDKDYESIQGHIIDGRVLFPATGWIYHVWETYAFMIGANNEKVKVIFEDIQFLRATSLVKNQDIYITISIHRGSGRFEVIEGVSAVACGYIKHADTIEMAEFDVPADDYNAFMKGEDFYKEMRLRGFYHSGPFQGVKEVRHDGLVGKLKWANNWTIFLDSMTHVDMSLKKSNKLSLPTNIRKVVIDPILHFKMLDEKLKEINERKMLNNESEKEEPEIIFDYKISHHLHIIKSGGIELHGKISSKVNRRRPKEPLLQSSKFVPFFPKIKYSLKDAAKVLSSTFLENIFKLKRSIVEIDSYDDKPFFCEFLSGVMQDTPQISSSITLLTSNNDLKVEKVMCSSEDIFSLSFVDVIVMKNCIGNQEFLNAVRSVLDLNGFIVSRENQDYSESSNENIHIVSKIHIDDGEILHILKFKEPVQTYKPQNIIEITSNVEEWLEPLKKSLKESSTIVYAYNHEPSGILGFINCIRREYASDKLKCFFIIDTKNAPSTFDINHEFFKSQLNFNYAVNIFKDDEWGGYRHLNMKQDTGVYPQNNHCLVNCLVKGDLSTLTWTKGPIDVTNLCQDIINIQYASLNFKDIMLTLGRIPDNCDEPISQRSILGFEFSGIKQNGDRVMCIGTKAGALATHYDAKDALLWNVPDSWTLEEAATVPLVYFTVYFAFFNTTTIKPGKKILIHSGSGGVGQAAIEVALAYGLEVFTTVSTEEKKNFLLNRFPKLKTENIGNSRNTTFEKMVLENTNGKGVDYVLNSLSGEKLHASIRCLGRDGVFLEIGKYDIVRGTNLDMRYLKKRISIKAVIFDDYFDNFDEIKYVYELMTADLNSGIIKPLNTTVFDINQVEEAFRFMANGKHIGKVLLKVRKDSSDSVSLPMMTINRVYFDSNESIIVVGGLGGFGMEFCEWLISRGCKKLIISSSRGLKTIYQKLKLRYWKKHGVNDTISTSDVTTEAGCEELINKAIELGPVGAIFNLAGVLRDGIFENLDVKMFNESIAPKGLATKYLDKLSRILCPNLKHFVVFSSISCGLGNAGQSNYGMANSIMERIVEDRHQNGLPGKAIQWGAIGDVGMLADFQLSNMGKDIGGTLPQSIPSCTEALDTLLTNDEPIVSSMVVADKQMEDFKKSSIIDIIIKIMGIRDKKSISMDSTLTQLGIDSLMGVEIQQIIEREFDITLTSQELRSLSLSQLEKRATSKTAISESSEDTENPEKNNELGEFTIEDMIDLDSIGSITEPILKVNDVDYHENTKVLILPWFYGFATKSYKQIGEHMIYPAYILQHAIAPECKNVDEIVEKVIVHIQKLFSDVDHFILIAHSFGGMLSLKIAKILEESGKSGQIIQLDSSPQFCQKYTLQSSENEHYADINDYLSKILFNYYQHFVDHNVVKNIIQNHDNWTERSKELSSVTANRIPFEYEYFMKTVCGAYENRINISRNVDESEFLPLENTKISLVRPTKSQLNGISKDYGLSEYSKHHIKVKFINGDHFNMLRNPELLLVIKSFINL